MSPIDNFRNVCSYNYRDDESQWLQQEQKRLDSLSEVLKQFDKDWQQCFQKASKKINPFKVYDKKSFL